MRKIGFFKSIHFKFILIYTLLILIAMQVIGVYFVRELEDSLMNNFDESLRERSQMLASSVEQEMTKDRSAEDSKTLEEDIRSLLSDIQSDNVLEVQVIDTNQRVVGTSNPYKQSFVGKRTTERMVDIALVSGQGDTRRLLDRGQRLTARTMPVKSNGSVLGVIYLVASMEEIYDEMNQINGIFATGTLISMLITALLGIFLAQTITRPISDMKRQARVMARGDFSRKVKVYGDDEIGQLALTFNDLTTKLKLAQDMTEEERKKLSSVLAHMTDGVIAADRQGHVILMNNQAEKMLHVSRETTIGESLLSILPIESDISLENIYEDDDSLIFDFYTGKDEESIIRANFSIIQNEHGYPNGFMTVLYDVTEQERIEQERREFVANVSHELRTPLTTMKSYIEALTDGAWQDKEIAPRFLGVTQTETERMIRLVNDLLQLSKLDSKDIKLNLNRVNFTPFYHGIIDRFELSKAQNVSFERIIPDENLYVYIDADRVTQVIDNIISNALKYSPEGGKVTFKLIHNPTDIQISIKDQGMGIPKDNLSKVFERFYRVDKARSRKMGGTGLGLAIAKEIIQLHGGRIWAESEEGKGTAINFVLPLERDREDDVL
ncbi:cell wall metabolism sensor histidine kinase WalK [Bacillus marinisedimentorum]|uniref:cell wall metabolism sensor histidine kinase WalK n=1 Tax=Bacillus marinisedimentorum TaxID=1821260 RepID=UPI000872395C|nr:cell wall metabolism sensor histidine kinase WalK [Bacillus marinisedimentorum]